MNTIPESFMRHDGCRFSDSPNTQYLIRAVESDSSQLTLTDQGTCLDPSLEPEFELRVYEVDDSGYRGLSGQFRNIQQIEEFYGVDLSGLNEQASSPDALMEMQEMHGIFADSVLTDDADNLVFCSLWGNDTSIRELQGRLTLGIAEGGITTFNLRSEDHKKFVRIGNVDSLEQMSGRVQTDILGELVHYWLYSREIVKPDLANHRAVLISQQNEATHVWPTIKHVCPIPLLDHWEDILMPILKNAGMIKSMTGIRQNGTQVAIDEDRMSLIVRNGCQDGSLTVNPA